MRYSLYLAGFLKTAGLCLELDWNIGLYPIMEFFPFYSGALHAIFCIDLNFLLCLSRTGVTIDLSPICRFVWDADYAYTPLP